MKIIISIIGLLFTLSIKSFACGGGMNARVTYPQTEHIVKNQIYVINVENYGYGTIGKFKPSRIVLKSNETEIKMKLLKKVKINEGSTQYVMQAKKGLNTNQKFRLHYQESKNDTYYDLVYMQDKEREVSTINTHTFLPPKNTKTKFVLHKDKLQHAIINIESSNQRLFLVKIKGKKSFFTTTNENNIILNAHQFGINQGDLEKISIQEVSPVGKLSNLKKSKDLINS